MPRLSKIVWTWMGLSLMLVPIPKIEYAAIAAVGLLGVSCWIAKQRGW
jgi:hypothetical protein